jgi:hypothetical protein
MAKQASKESVLHTVKDGEATQDAQMTAKFRVSQEQAEAFKSLPKELQDRLGPPVYGSVLSAPELRALGARLRIQETSSTIMCPW